MKLVTAGGLLTGEQGERVADGAVVVEGATIAYAGPAGSVPTGLADAVTDVTDLGPAVTLLPGLIDSHVHLAFDGGPNPVETMKAASDPELLVQMLASARRLLSVGVTTARDLGARSFLDIVVRDAVASGMARGPRLVTAGPPLTVTGGHCWFMGGECDDEVDVRRRVRLHHKMGVDLIKVMSTGGFMTTGSAPWYAQFSDEQLVAIVEEAHRVGKRVAAHAHGVEGIRRSVAAGVDTLEHCSFFQPDGTNVADVELVDRIVAAGTYVCPTINARLLEMLAIRGNDFVPPVRVLHERGAKIIAGTDAGINNIPHHAYVGGLEAMATVGLPVDEVLYAATVRAAEALGLDSVTGRLVEGLEADVIGVDGDPQRDVTALHELRYVMARGVPFAPDPVERFVPDPATARERAARYLATIESAPQRRAVSSS